MAERPESLPRWASDEIVDNVSGQLNAVEPPESAKDAGFNRDQIPPRQWLNWLFRESKDWIRALAAELDDLEIAKPKLIGVDEQGISSDDDLPFIAQGRAVFGQFEEGLMYVLTTTGELGLMRRTATGWGTVGTTKTGLPVGGDFVEGAYLGDRTVAVVSGGGDRELANFQYDYDTEEWTEVGTRFPDAVGPNPGTLYFRRLNKDGDFMLSQAAFREIRVYRWDPVALTWDRRDSFPLYSAPDSGTGQVVLGENLVVAFGSDPGSDGALVTTARWDPVAQEMTTEHQAVFPPRVIAATSAAVAVTDDTVVVLSGNPDTVNINGIPAGFVALRYDANEPTWIQVGRVWPTPNGFIPEFGRMDRLDDGTIVYKVLFQEPTAIARLRFRSGGPLVDSPLALTRPSFSED